MRATGIISSQYSEEFKESTIVRMLPPHDESVPEFRDFSLLKEFEGNTNVVLIYQRRNKSWAEVSGTNRKPGNASLLSPVVSR
jgi:poly-D-alanine transfer protein DltD